MPLLLINLVLAVAGLLDGITLGSLNRVGTGVAMLLTALFARVFALKAQDRVIRLEERLRMERLLPDDLKPRIDDVSTAQCVALRFSRRRRAAGPGSPGARREGRPRRR